MLEGLSVRSLIRDHPAAIDRVIDALEQQLSPMLAVLLLTKSRQFFPLFYLLALQ